jgi:hypothetical protein
MSRFATRFLGALLLISLAAIPAMATQYPPGPGGTCPDSLTVVNIQNPAASCHPANGDSVYGVGGICTAFDTKTSGVGFYMQISGGGPYTGIDCFTANEIPLYSRGDSVVVETAQYTKYLGDPELTSLSGSWGHMIVRFVSSGNAVPPFHDGSVHEFSSALSNIGADQWAGCLVRVTSTQLRTARITGAGAGSWYAVDNILCPPGSGGPCDSMYIDGNTLCNPTLGQPALGTLASTIQGIYGLNTTYGPRIRARDANDVVWISPTPPNLSDAYAVHADTIRVVFDIAVTTASAQNTANYSLGSAGTILSATLEANGNCVDVAIDNGLDPGDPESITVSNVASVVTGTPMPSPQSRNFYNGVIPIMTIRAPDPDSLSAIPCQDRSRFSGVGSAFGNHVTFRGICAGTLPGSLSYIEDASAAQRSAITGYGLPTVTGHQYLVVCGVQEYYGETEAVYPAYVRDEGVATVPTPVVQTVHVLRDSTCDATQTLTNGKDYASMLVELIGVKDVADTSYAGMGFDVVQLGGVPGDTLHITNRSSLTWTYEALPQHCYDIVGVLRFDFGAYVVCPRSNADFYTSGAGVTPTTPEKVTFSVFPNPARSATVSFALPRAMDVDLSVFDLGGRKIATLAKGAFAAGPYTRVWNGQGSAAGVYFVRLRAGSEVYNIRTINLK